MAVRIAVAQGALAVLDDLRVELAAEVEFVTGPIDTPARVAELTEGAQALIVALHPLDAVAFAAMADTVQVIGRAGVGLDTIDLVAAEKHGIAVVYQPAYAVGEVSTHAVSMLLALQRRLVSADAAVRAGWGSAADVGRVFSLDQAAVGVLGCGRIGRAAVERLRPFVGELRVFDPVLDTPVPGVRQVDSLDELVTGLDALTLHCPLTPQTRHVIGEREISLLRAGALLVNVSRGGLVDEGALADALTSGHLAGAALDVFETEPLPAGSPLREAPNLLLSPHVAWYSDVAARRLCEWTVRDSAAYASTRAVVHGSLAVAPAVARVPAG